MILARYGAKKACVCDVSSKESKKEYIKILHNEMYEMYEVPEQKSDLCSNMSVLSLHSCYVCLQTRWRAAALAPSIY